MRLFRCGDEIRVTRDWEPELCDPDHVSKVGQVGVIKRTLIDDCGATPQSPGFIVDNDIGLVWPEEMELIE